MKTIFKIFAFCLLAQSAHSQACDTTGILLELQATTNLQGILFGDNRCLTTATVLAPLYVSSDTLRIDTTGLGGGGGATDIYYVDNGGNDVDITSSTGSGFKIVGLGNIQIYENAVGEIAIDGSGIPSSKWTDAGLFTYLTSTTDRAVVGSATELNTAYIFQAKGGIFSQGGGSTSATFAGVFEKADGTDIMNIRNDGRVGILNSAPAYTLDVAGDISIRAADAYRVGAVKLAYSPAVGYYFFGGAGNVTANSDRAIGIGTNALLNLTTGALNVAIGDDALKNCTTCNQNFAIGSGTLQRCTTGTANVGIGLYVLNFNTASNNTAIGDQVMTVNSTGTLNVGIGTLAVYNNTTASSNTGVGAYALINNSTGGDNTALGRSTLENLNGGIRNIAIGNYAADNLTTGGRNICIGWNIDMPTATTSETLNIGNLLFGTGINVSGTTISGGSVGIGVSAPARKLHVAGEVRIADLSTDNPTVIVGADGDGDLDDITVGTGLTLSAGVLSSTATSYTDEEAQDAVGNILVDGTTIDFTYNDATPSITAEVINNSISNAKIRQGAARSVIGVTGNALANVADIQGTTDQVLRVNGAGTALAFGQVATGGIADDAVTYGKIQNVAANNVLLGNDSGAGSDVQELSTTEVQTMLGYIDGGGANQRIAYFTDANTVAAEAAFLYDAGNDRQTIVCTTPSFGAGAAILNLSNDGTDTNGEFLQMRGSITNLLTATMQNTSTAATSGVVLGISQSGNSAGDPYIQTQISGTGGNTTSFGMDNSDANKFKISPNANNPGANADASLVATMDAIPLWGINKDAPGRMLDVGGDVRAINLVNTDSPPDASALGNGLGTGGTVDAVTGGNNGFTVTFTTGTGCVLDGPLFRLTFDNPFTITSHIIMDCHRDVDSIAECDKFLQNGTSPGFIDLKANGTLLDGKTHILKFLVIGQ